MSYNIRLPNGELIQGIPNHIEPEQILKTLESDEASYQSELQDRSWGQNFAAGAGRSMINTGRNLANLVGAVSNEELEESERLDQNLLQQEGSGWGGFAGDLATFAIPGGAAAKIGGLSKALRARPFQSALATGAGTGYLTSTPSTRLEGTGMGVLGGAAGTGLVKALRGVGKGIIPTRESANKYLADIAESVRAANPNASPQELKKLIEEAGGDFLPVTMRGEGPGHTVYNYLMPFLPGGRGAIKKQEEAAFDKFRTRTMDAASPDRAVLPAVDPKDIPKSFGELNVEVDRMMKGLDDFIVNPGDVGLLDKFLSAGNPGLKPKTWNELKKNLLNSIDSDGNISLGAIRELKDQVKALSGQLDAPVARSIMSRVDNIWEEAVSSLKTDPTRAGTQAASSRSSAGQAIDDYESVMGAYPEYKVLTAAGAQSDKFTPRHLLQASKADSATPIAAAGQGVLQSQAQSALDALGDPRRAATFWQTWSAYGAAAGAAGLGLLPSALVASIAVPLGSRVLASQVVQKAFMGDAKSQKMIQRLLSGKKGQQMKEAIENQIIMQTASQSGQSTQ